MIEILKKGKPKTYIVICEECGTEYSCYKSDMGTMFEAYTTKGILEYSYVTCPVCTESNKVIISTRN